MRLDAFILCIWSAPLAAASDTSWSMLQSMHLDYLGMLRCLACCR